MINKINNGGRLIPGKVFEYIGAGKPILGIGPVTSDVAEILNESNTGKMIDWEDHLSTKQFILQQIESKDKRIENDQKIKYNRKFLTGKLVNFYKEVLS